MIHKSCLTKLGDHRNNLIAEKQKKDASFMVAWKELVEIIEFLENSVPAEPCHVVLKRPKSKKLKSIERSTIKKSDDTKASDSQNERKISQQISQNTKSSRTTTATPTAAEQITTDLDSHSYPRQKLNQRNSNRLVKPCYVVLMRLTNEQLKSIEQSTIKKSDDEKKNERKAIETDRSKQLKSNEKPTITKADDVMSGGPLKEKNKICVDKKSQIEFPAKMVTRNQSKKLKHRRNKENE